MFQIKVLLRPVRTAPVAINQPLFSGATSRAPILSCSPERIWLGEGGKSLLAHCGAPGPGQTLATLTSSWTVNTSMCVSLLETPLILAEPGSTRQGCSFRAQHRVPVDSERTAGFLWRYAGRKVISAELKKLDRTPKLALFYALKQVPSY